MKKRVLLFIGMLCFLVGCGRTGSSDNVGNELAKAYGLYESGEYEAAKTIFENYTETAACEETALIGLGKCSAGMGENEEALSAYNAVLEKNPENRSCLYDRAILYEQTGNTEGAYDDYNKLYGLDQGDSFAWNKVETYLKENGLLEELLSKYQMLEGKGDERIFAWEIELLAALEREDEIPAVIDRFEDEAFRQLCLKQLEAYNSLKQGDSERAKEILFSYENFMAEDMMMLSVYMGGHNGAFQREGAGILITDEYPDTQIYVGEWKAGVREGNGSAFNAYAGGYEDGGLHFHEAILEGIWQNNLPGGMCKHTQAYGYFEDGIQLYRDEESYTADYTDGVVNGELIIERFEENQYGDQRTSSEKLMIEDGNSVPYTYDDSFKWDVY